MKKIVAVLVLALVAMTAVFALEATKVKSNDDLVIKLDVAGYTKFGFTTVDYSSKEDLDVTLANDITDMKQYLENNPVTVYATVISTNKTGVDVEIELPAYMTNTDTNVRDTIAITYNSEWDAEGAKSYSLNATSGVLRDSQPITFYIEDPTNKVAGTYQATLKMHVTAK